MVFYFFIVLVDQGSSYEHGIELHLNGEFMAETVVESQGKKGIFVEIWDFFDILTSFGELAGVVCLVVASHTAFVWWAIDLHECSSYANEV